MTEFGDGKMCDSFAQDDRISEMAKCATASLRMTILGGGAL
jgi:hypothetical protein